MAAIIRAENLTKIYAGQLKAVDSISFDVEEGEIYGFLGPNGAGKTTTILVLITLLKPTGGKATLCGYDVAKETAKVRSCIGYVSQDTAVDENLTGRENLLLQGRFYHLPKDTLKNRIDEVLEMVDLKDRANDLVSTYSGGMRKRLDIAEGLIHRPKILFVDEPTLGLDIQTRHKIWDYIQRLRKEFNMTIFLTTHYMDEADALCDRISIIDYGKIKVIGKPNELKNQIGGDIITLKFSEQNGKTEEAIAKIKALPFVEAITPIRLPSAPPSLPPPTRRGMAPSFPSPPLPPVPTGSYTIVAKNGETTVPKIFETANSVDVKIQAISLKRPTLDDVFLAYTGRALREEEGSKDEIMWERMRLRRVRQ